VQVGSKWIPHQYLLDWHFTEKIPTAKKAKLKWWCTVCSKYGNKKESIHWCPDWKVGLCIKTCFKTFHTNIILNFKLELEKVLWHKYNSIFWVLSSTHTKFWLNDLADTVNYTQIKLTARYKGKYDNLQGVLVHKLKADHFPSPFSKSPTCRQKREGKPNSSVFP
jgi:hypothetical protein